MSQATAIIYTGLAMMLIAIVIRLHNTSVLGFEEKEEAKILVGMIGIIISFLIRAALLIVQVCFCKDLSLVSPWVDIFYYGITELLPVGYLTILLVGWWHHPPIRCCSPDCDGSEQLPLIDASVNSGGMDTIPNSQKEWEYLLLFIGFC